MGIVPREEERKYKEGKLALGKNTAHEERDFKNTCVLPELRLLVLHWACDPQCATFAMSPLYQPPLIKTQL